MFTMGSAVTLVTDWVGDAGRVVEYGVALHQAGRRALRRPAPTSRSPASSRPLDPETKRVTVELTATAAGEKVLGRALAVAVLD